MLSHHHITDILTVMSSSDCADKATFVLLRKVIKRHINLMEQEKGFGFVTTRVPWHNDTKFGPHVHRAGQKLLNDLNTGAFTLSKGDKIQAIKQLRSYSGNQGEQFWHSDISLKDAKEFIEQFFAKWYN